jgi:hypothetical protein
VVELESLLVSLASLDETSLVQVLSKRSLEVVFSWRSLLLTECSPRASYYLEQKVGGSWIFIVGKTKNLF